LSGKKQKRANKVPDVAIHTIAKRFEKPTEDEGFIQIKKYDKEMLDDIFSR
jgi:hypothetical protein